MQVVFLPQIAHSIGVTDEVQVFWHLVQPSRGDSGRIDGYGKRHDGFG
jgi:hypothetical protein